ncbi:PREDICTED: translation initiation factor IF-2-like [Chinchilla lanigera]|uniref:translation initiation factor IF-2-like n=1 Tax=Chinchilla lanigera TaxID=34839 RepID=UPI000698BC9A|nr:PREDICTED: translation initiation factor IF-2-like [Chinchilla lanigera]
MRVRVSHICVISTCPRCLLPLLCPQPCHILPPLCLGRLNRRRLSFAVSSSLQVRQGRHPCEEASSAASACTAPARLGPSRRGRVNPPAVCISPLCAFFFCPRPPAARQPAPLPAPSIFQRFPHCSLQSGPRPAPRAPRPASSCRAPGSACSMHRGSHHGSGGWAGPRSPRPARAEAWPLCLRLRPTLRAGPCSVHRT